MQENGLDTVKKEFFKYLENLGLSGKSYKNYRSDLNHFLSWGILKVRSFGSYPEGLTDLIPFLSPTFTNEYKSFMVEGLIPRKTTNRRLSTLRHMTKFLVSSQIVDIDFMENIENIPGTLPKKRAVSPILASFRTHLETEKVSPNTIRNYLNDIKQFMAWLENYDTLK